MPKITSHEVGKERFPEALTEFFNNYKDVWFAFKDLHAVKIVSKKINLPMKPSNRRSFLRWLSCPDMQKKIEKAFKDKNRVNVEREQVGKTRKPVTTDESQKTITLRQYPAIHKTQKLELMKLDLILAEKQNQFDSMDSVPLVVISDDNVTGDNDLMEKNNMPTDDCFLESNTQPAAKNETLSSGLLRLLI